MNAAGIYRIVVTRPNEPPKFYIGQAAVLRKRRTVHFRSLRRGTHKNQPLQRAFAKYGETAFSFEILLVCERRREILDLYEQIILDSYDRSAIYNISRECVGSRLGVSTRPETRAKQSAAMKGRPRTPSQIEGVRRANRARIVSAETRAKMAAAHAGNKNSVGKRLSDAHKAKIAVFWTGKKKPREEVARRQRTRAANREAQGLAVY